MLVRGGNGHGMGELPGITSCLECLSALGVDAAQQLFREPAAVPRVAAVSHGQVKANRAAWLVRSEE